MTLVKIDDIVINPDHVEAITPATSDVCYLRMISGESYRVACSVIDMLTFLDMLEFEIMKIDIKKIQVARKEKTGS
jgi:hypothetical protein